MKRSRNCQRWGISLLIGYMDLVRVAPLPEYRCSHAVSMISGRKQREVFARPESAKTGQKLKPCYCNVSTAAGKSLPGRDPNRILVFAALRVNWIQSLEAELRGWTINSRGNERSLRTCGNCAPDRDQRYQIQSEQTQEVVLISVQDIEISYNRKKDAKMQRPRSKLYRDRS